MDKALPVQKIIMLCGLPTDAKSFASRRGTSDFLARYPTNDGYPQKYRANVAGPLTRFFELAERLPFVEVWKDELGTLSALGEATAEADVVILLTHWKGPKIGNDDMPRRPDETFDLDRLIGCLARSDRTEATDLLDRFREVGPNLTGVQARNILNEAVCGTAPTTMEVDGKVVDFQIDDLVFWSQNREALDEILPLDPGNRLELMDGLYTADEVAAVIDRDFVGILDLVACTSTFLSQKLSEYFDFQFRIVAFPEEQKFDTHVEVLKLLLGCLTEGMTYLEARQQARVEFEALVEQEQRKRWIRRIKRCLLRLN